MKSTRTNLHFVYLAAGMVVSVLFFVLREECYALLFDHAGFSDALYNTGLYNTVALITIGMAWVCAGIYYYAINSVYFDRWYHWLAMLAVTVVLTPLVCYAVSASVLHADGLEYGQQNAAFELSNIVWSALLFVVASYSIRWWSSNCRHTPIPQ